MIELSHITKQYSFGMGRKIIAVNDVSLIVNTGEMTAVMGKSGAGKSTLLNIIAGIDMADSGTMTIDTKPVNMKSARALAEHRNKNIGYIIQNFGLLDELTAVENVILPLKYKKGKLSKKQKLEKGMSLLREVGLEDFAGKYPAEMSGGECQRAAIARALVCDPSLLLADEPTGSLDTANEKAIIDIFKKLKSEGKTIIIVTHDAAVAECCDRVINMESGRITD